MPGLQTESCLAGRADWAQCRTIVGSDLVTRRYYILVELFSGMLPLIFARIMGAARWMSKTVILADSKKSHRGGRCVWDLGNTFRIAWIAFWGGAKSAKKTLVSGAAPAKMRALQPFSNSVDCPRAPEAPF